MCMSYLYVSDGSFETTAILFELFETIGPIFKVSSYNYYLVLKANSV